MHYSNTKKATFISRPNRFIAKVMLEGREETVHVKNTGRCRELLLPGADIILQRSDNPERKTAYDLIAVKKPGLGWVNIDSQVPNACVKEWLLKRPGEFKDLTELKPEYTYGNSRVDFYIECADRKALLEVKGCTLERDLTGYFPDAPTERGVKHLKELAKAAAEGYDAYIAFVIAMPGISTVLPNEETDPDFALAYKEALRAGVKVLFLTCSLGPDYIEIDCP